METFGERLNWARLQKGMSLHALAQASELNTAYISQLMKKENPNPTIGTIERLAKALDVSVSFLVGEVIPRAVGSASPVLAHPFGIGRSFREAFDSFTPEERQRFEQGNVEDRIACAVNFLCEHFPEVLGPSAVAYHLGISLLALKDIVHDRTEPGFCLVRQLAALTGIPYAVLATGMVDDFFWTTYPSVPPSLPDLITIAVEPSIARPEGRISLDVALQYARPLSLALANEMTPENLECAVRQYIKSKWPGPVRGSLLEPNPIL